MKRTHHPQQGFVLVTSLVFLIVLSLLGVMAMRGSLFEERMAANDRDRSMAKEYAEMALRDAERDILGLRFDGTACAAPGPGCTTPRPPGTRPASAGGASSFWGFETATALDGNGSFVASDNGGLGQPIAVQGMFSAGAAVACGMPVWSGANWQDGANPARSCAGTIGAAVPTVAYGTFTDAPFLAPAGVPRPRYIIELFTSNDMELTGGEVGAAGNKLFFRITAVGFGRMTGANNQRTSVTLQTVFSPN